MVLEGEKILKLQPMYVDVAVIVRNMRHAATVVNVPRVYDYGYSGNCAFILMAYIFPAASLHRVLRGNEEWVFKYLEPQVDMIVRKLAGIGLSHNDFYPRNIMVGEDWDIVAIIDWDESGPLHSSREYLRRVRWGEDTHDWD
jgi:RIO-like serine/threonine protein kinase